MTKLICITCPRGCHLEVDDNMNVTGNFCPRGAKYAVDELTNPKRMVTSTVKVLNGELKRLPVMTSAPIPKDKIFDVMEEIKKVEVSAPLELGSVIIENILDLGVNIVSTRTLK